MTQKTSSVSDVRQSDLNSTQAAGSASLEQLRADFAALDGRDDAAALEWLSRSVPELASALERTAQPVAAVRNRG